MLFSFPAQEFAAMIELESALIRVNPRPISTIAIYCGRSDLTSIT
jgi:hypothetical protein